MSKMDTTIKGLVQYGEGLEISRAQTPIERIQLAAQSVTRFCGDKIRDYAYRLEEKAQAREAMHESAQQLGYISLSEYAPVEAEALSEFPALTLVHSVTEIELPLTSQFYDQDQAQA